MKKFILAVGIAAVFASCRQAEPIDSVYKRVLDVACAQTDLMLASISPGEYPRSVKDGALWTSDYKWWCSGYFPGVLWELVAATGANRYIEAADRLTAGLETLKTTTSQHDIGLQIICSYGRRFNLFGKECDKEEIIASARHLAARFNPNTGCILSWDAPRDRPELFRVIIDNMMVIELLMEAAELSGDTSLSDIAVSHALTTMKNHFRPDHSSWHVVEYDPHTGAVTSRHTHQGYSDDSSWSRGQAWGLYGFTMMYRYTKDSRFLEHARGIASYILSRLPEDLIPYWDYDDPAIPDAPRDASAAALAASAFAELSGYVSGKEGARYLEIAEKTLRTLSSPEYLAEPGTNCGFILKHSTGNLPGHSEIDAPLSYADYYFLEAWERLMKRRNQ